MNSKDLKLVTLLGFLVGLLIQPLLINNGIDTLLAGFIGGSVMVARLLVLVFFGVLAPVALAVAGFLARWVAIVYQIAKFAAVGSLNSFIDLGLFNLLGILFGVPIGGSPAFALFKSISFLAATTNSYFWNKLWTFGDQSKSGAEKVVTFYLVTATNWLVNVGVATGVSAIQPENTLWVTVISPIVGIFAGMAGNFLGYKFIVFRKKTETQ